MKTSFIVWNRFQRRAVSINRFLEAKIYFFQSKFLSKKYRFIDYTRHAIKTIFVLWRDNPEVVLIQLPPVPLLYIVFLFKFLTGGKFKIVADCHNSMLREFWLKWPFCKVLLHRCSAVLVHNEEVVKLAVSLGISNENLMVLEDPPASNIYTYSGHHVANFAHPWILFPSSFSPDEPIEKALNAARLAPEIVFVFTGDPKRRKDTSFIKSKPKNVLFTGYVATEQFERFLFEADAILGLTTEEGIQLSVCNEALGFGKPMILSGTAILKRLFYKGAVFVDTSSEESIALGCKECLKNIDALQNDCLSLKEEREIRWQKQFQKMFVCGNTGCLPGFKSPWSIS